MANCSWWVGIGARAGDRVSTTSGHAATGWPGIYRTRCGRGGGGGAEVEAWRWRRRGSGGGALAERARQNSTPNPHPTPYPHLGGERGESAAEFAKVQCARLVLVVPGDDAAQQRVHRDLAHRAHLVSIDKAVAVAVEVGKALGEAQKLGSAEVRARRKFIHHGGGRRWRARHRRRICGCAPAATAHSVAGESVETSSSASSWQLFGGGSNVMFFPSSMTNPNPNEQIQQQNYQQQSAW